MANHDDPDAPLPVEHAETILAMMAHAYDVRSIEGIDYDAIRELARWTFRRYPALREKYPLDCRLGMRRHP